MTDNIEPIIWKEIPPGTVRVGVPGYSGDYYYVEITKAFRISADKITRAVWSKVMNDGKCDDMWIPDGIDDPGALPMTHIAQDEAIQFIKNYQNIYGVKADFPTQAQWSLACVANTMFMHYWDRDSGDESNEQYASRFAPILNNCSSGSIELKKIRNYPPNPNGLYDLLGHGWEYTKDRYEPMKSAPYPRRSIFPKNGKIVCDYSHENGSCPLMIGCGENNSLCTLDHMLVILSLSNFSDATLRLVINT